MDTPTRAPPAGPPPIFTPSQNPEIVMYSRDIGESIVAGQRGRSVGTGSSRMRVGGGRWGSRLGYGVVVYELD